MAATRKLKRGRPPKSGPKRVVRVPVGMIGCYDENGRALVFISREEWERVIVPAIAPNAVPSGRRGGGGGPGN